MGVKRASEFFVRVSKIFFTLNDWHFWCVYSCLVYVGQDFLRVELIQRLNSILFIGLVGDNSLILMRFAKIDPKGESCCVKECKKCEWHCVVGCFAHGSRYNCKNSMLSQQF
ncbi:hypothetical protein BLOT_016076 [Blomia tropicalis]|nr:hypothetical protein BLOT_016076 [Blomia tropicalis]